MNLPLRLAPVLLLISLAAPLARSQQLLDSYSLPDFSNATSGYVIKANTAATWSAQSGTLWPQASNQYTALAWTANSLQTIGDSFSIDVDLNPSTFGHNGGLAVWTSLTAATAPNSPVTDRVFEPRFSWAGGSGYSFQSENFNQSISGDATGWTTLTVTLSGRTATNTLLTASLSGAGFTTLVDDYTVANWTGALYVGPSAYQASGGNVAFDNLSYTAASAVPEPSTYAAIAGLSALGLAAWRRRATSAASARRYVVRPTSAFSEVVSRNT